MSLSMLVRVPHPTRNRILQQPRSPPRVKMKMQNKSKHPNHLPFRSYGIGELEWGSQLYKSGRWFSWSVFLNVRQRIDKPLPVLFYRSIYNSDWPSRLSASAKLDECRFAFYHLKLSAIVAEKFDGDTCRTSRERQRLGVGWCIHNGLVSASTEALGLGIGVLALRGMQDCMISVTLEYLRL